MRIKLVDLNVGANRRTMAAACCVDGGGQLVFSATLIPCAASGSSGKIACRARGRLRRLRSTQDERERPRRSGSRPAVLEKSGLNAMAGDSSESDKRVVLAAQGDASSWK